MVPARAAMRAVWGPPRADCRVDVPCPSDDLVKRVEAPTGNATEAGIRIKAMGLARDDRRTAMEGWSEDWGEDPMISPHQGPIMVFDTNCVLCSQTVAFVLAHEREPTVRFAGAWSPEGRAMGERYGFSQADLDRTFLLIEGGRALTHSDAGLALLRYLRAPWACLRIGRVVPKPLRDRAYSAVARRRYRWFGHRENCTVVPPDQRHRFIGVPSSGPQPPDLREPAAGAK